MEVEEQTQWNIETKLITNTIRSGQKLTIPNREVTKLAFVIKRFGGATGDVTFAIRKVSDGSILASKVWGDAGDLPTTPTWEEVTFDTPVTINEEVWIYTEFLGGTTYAHILFYRQNTDVKADEVVGYYRNEAWTDIIGQDAAYRYTYSTGGNPPANNWIKRIETAMEDCPSAEELEKERLENG